ncbi:IclR family transcriptional regulator [Mesorhizobium sp. 10J20-29]
MKQKLSGYDHRLVRRIAAIMNCIGGYESPVRLVDIAGQTGLDSATAYRILSELVREGFVYKNRATRCYTPGLQICQLGSSEFAHSSAVDSLQPVLSQIELLTGLTALLGSRKGSRVQLYSQPSAIARHPSVTEALRAGVVDAHATSIGKVLLSAADPAEVKSLYAASVMERHTTRTTSGYSSLVRELQQIRVVGHATECGEYSIGLNGIGIMVPTQTGRPTFGIWLTTTNEHLRRLSSEAIIEHAKAILAKAVKPNSEH